MTRARLSKPAITALGLSAAMLTGCGSGAGNNEAAGKAPKANATANAAALAPAPERPSTLSLDRQRLTDTCIPRIDRERPIQQLGAARRAALNLCLNEETARQLAPQLPIRINANTQIDGVTVEGGALVYRYRLAGRIAELSVGTPDRLEAMTRRNACAGEDVPQTIALGGVQIYRWVDRDGAPIREVRIERC